MQPVRAPFLALCLAVLLAALNGGGLAMAATMAGAPAGTAKWQVALEQTLSVAMAQDEAEQKSEPALVSLSLEADQLQPNRVGPCKSDCSAPLPTSIAITGPPLASGSVVEQDGGTQHHPGTRIRPPRA